MSWKKTVGSLLTNAVRNAPEIAAEMQRRGQTLVQAGELMQSVVDPNGPVRTALDAAREGRIGIDFSEGSVSVRIRERNAKPSGNRVHF